jgi:hypothetical protein
VDIIVEAGGKTDGINGDTPIAEDKSGQIVMKRLSVNMPV